jgi:hypothetical protein
VTCPLRTAKRPVKRGTLPLFAGNVPVTVTPGSVCDQAFTTFQPGEIPLSQRELYGTKEWYFSFARRNRVEGFFGNTKNEAVETLRRGSVRVIGGNASGLLQVLTMAATNLRFASLWDQQQSKPKTAKPIRSGRPRKTPLARYREATAHIDGANAPPKAS